MLKNEFRRPQIYDYLRTTEYLQDFYNYRKKENSGFTYDVWSLELGYKSRSFLRMLASGERKVTSDFSEKFCKRLGFSDSEAQYFTLLAKHEQAQNQDEKLLFMNRILEHIGARKELHPIPPAEGFLLNKDMPNIFMILGFRDVEKTSTAISTLLRMDIQTVEDHLEELQRWGLIKKVGGFWHSISESFRVPQKLTSDALEAYHNANADEMKQAQKIEARLRRFRTLLFALSDSEFHDLLQDVEQLVGRSLAKFDQKEMASRRLYKMNINVYPVTEEHKAEHKAEHKTGLCHRSENTKDIKNDT